MTVDAGESAVIEKKMADVVADTLEDKPAEKFGVNYSCLRCNTVTSGEEISRLPEIKCICGFKVFIKVRPPTVKSVKAV